MKNLINNVFTILVRQHYVLYVFIGVVLGYLFALNVGYQGVINISKMWGTENVVLSVLVIFFLYGIFVYIFYGRAGKHVQVTRYGIVVKDIYFPTKIASNISSFEKASGYLYVIFRIIILAVLHGFVAGVALFMLGAF